MDQPRGADEQGHRAPSVRSSVSIGAGLVLLLGLGVAALVLSWSHAAGTPLVPLQVPAVLAAMIGVGLIGTGLAAVDLNGLRRQEAEEAEALAAAVEVVRRRAERGRPVRID